MWNDRLLWKRTMKVYLNDWLIDRLLVNTETTIREIRTEPTTGVQYKGETKFVKVKHNKLTAVGRRYEQNRNKWRKKAVENTFRLREKLQTHTDKLTKDFNIQLESWVRGLWNLKWERDKCMKTHPTSTPTHHFMVCLGEKSVNTTILVLSPIKLCRHRVFGWTKKRWRRRLWADDDWLWLDLKWSNSPEWKDFNWSINWQSSQAVMPNED